MTHQIILYNNKSFVILRFTERVGCSKIICKTFMLIRFSPNSSLVVLILVCIIIKKNVSVNLYPRFMKIRERFQCSCKLKCEIKCLINQKEINMVDKKWNSNNLVQYLKIYTKILIKPYYRFEYPILEKSITCQCFNSIKDAYSFKMPLEASPIIMMEKVQIGYKSKCYLSKLRKVYWKPIYECKFDSRKITITNNKVESLSKESKYIYDNMGLDGDSLLLNLTFSPFKTWCACYFIFEPYEFYSKHILFFIPKSYIKLTPKKFALKATIFCTAFNVMKQYTIEWYCDFGKGFIMLGQKPVPILSEYNNKLYNVMEPFNKSLRINLSLLRKDLQMKCQVKSNKKNEQLLLYHSFSILKDKDVSISIKPYPLKFKTKSTFQVIAASLQFDYNFFCTFNRMRVKMGNFSPSGLSKIEQYVYSKVKIKSQSVFVDLLIQPLDITCTCEVTHTVPIYDTFYFPWFLPKKNYPKVFIKNLNLNKTVNESGTCEVTYASTEYHVQWTCDFGNGFIELGNKVLKDKMKDAMKYNYVNILEQAGVIKISSKFQFYDIPCRCFGSYLYGDVYPFLYSNIWIAGKKEIPKIFISPTLPTLDDNIKCLITYEPLLFQYYWYCNVENIYFRIGSGAKGYFSNYENYIYNGLTIKDSIQLVFKIKVQIRNITCKCVAQFLKPEWTFELSKEFSLPKTTPITIKMDSDYPELYFWVKCTTNQIPNEYNFEWLCDFINGTISIGTNAGTKLSLYEQYVYKKLKILGSVFKTEAIIVNDFQYNCRCVGKHSRSIFPTVYGYFKLRKLTNEDIYFHISENTYMCSITHISSKYIKFSWYCRFNEDPVELGLQFTDTLLQPEFEEIYNSIDVFSNFIMLTKLYRGIKALKCYCQPYLEGFENISNLFKNFTFDPLDTLKLSISPSIFTYNSYIKCSINSVADKFFSFTLSCLFENKYLKLGENMPLNFSYFWLYSRLPLPSSQVLLINISFVMFDIKCNCVALSKLKPIINLYKAFIIPFKKMSLNKLLKYNYKYTSLNSNTVWGIHFVWFLLLTSIFLLTAFYYTWKKEIRACKNLYFYKTMYYDTIQIIANNETGVIKINLTSKRYNCISSRILEFLKKLKILENWMDVKLTYTIHLTKDLKLFDFLEGKISIAKMTKYLVNEKHYVAENLFMENEIFDQEQEIIIESPLRTAKKVRSVRYFKLHRKDALLSKYNVTISKDKLIQDIYKNMSRNSFNKYLNNEFSISTSDEDTIDKYTTIYKVHDRQRQTKKNEIKEELHEIFPEVTLSTILLERVDKSSIPINTRLLPRGKRNKLTSAKPKVIEPSLVFKTKSIANDVGSYQKLERVSTKATDSIESKNKKKVDRRSSKISLGSKLRGMKSDETVSNMSERFESKVTKTRENRRFSKTSKIQQNKKNKAKLDELSSRMSESLESKMQIQDSRTSRLSVTMDSKLLLKIVKVDEESRQDSRSEISDPFERPVQSPSKLSLKKRSSYKRPKLERKISSGMFNQNPFETAFERQQEHIRSVLEAKVKDLYP